MFRLSTFALTISMVMFAPAAQAQPAAGGGAVGGGGFGAVGFGGGGGVRMVAGAGTSPQHREQTLNAVKQELGASDAEWEKLSPRIEKAMDAKHDLVTGAGLSWSSSNGAPPVFSVSKGNVDTAAGKVMQEIRAALENPETPADEITRKLAALKEEIAKARVEFDKAKKELNEVLTPRQQAILATMGIVE